MLGSQKHYKSVWKGIIASLVISLPLFAIMILTPVFFTEFQASASDNWYGGSWTYRREIAIDNTANTDDLTGYQVRITLNSSNFDFSKANSDGSDIRFTDSDGTTGLSYWIESYDSAGKTALIWVKVPNIAVSSTKHINIYYGNDDASTTSSADDTFILYDDFKSCGAADNYDSFSAIGTAIVPGTSGAWDEKLRERMVVLYDEGVYKAWYAGHKVTGGEATSEIGYATSPDGIAWTKYPSNPVLSRPEQDQDPSVLKIGNTYYLYVERTVNSPVRIYVDLFTSTDGITWNASLSNPVKSDAASPLVWVEGNTWYMLYEDFTVNPNNDINLATSSDGITWVDDPSNPVIENEEPGGFVSPDSIIKDGSVYHLYYHKWLAPYAMYATSTNLTDWGIGSINYPRWESFFVMDVGDEVWAYAWNSRGHYTTTMGGVSNAGFHLLKGYKEANCLSESKWEIVKKGTGSEINLNPTGLELIPYEKTISSASIKSKFKVRNNFAIEVRRKNIGRSYSDISVGSENVVDADTGGATNWWHTTLQSGYLWKINHIEAAADSGILKVPSAGGASAISNLFFPSANIQTNYEVHTLAYDGQGNLYWYADGLLKASAQDLDFLQTEKNILISQGEYIANSAGGHSFYDWIRVRKFSSVEPSSTIGEEEHAPPSSPTCNDTAPQPAPDLFQIDASDSQATLYFAPTRGSVNKYAILYGYTPGDERFGVEYEQGESTGVLSYTIGHLSPNTNYYFKVRAGNGCATGNWSNELSATTTGKLSVFTNNLESNILEVEERQVSNQKQCKTYTVASGDSLIRISQDQLGDSTKVSQLIEQNKDKYPSLKTNPSALEVGWGLTISCDGKDQEQSQLNNDETQTKELKKTVLIKVVDEDKKPVKGAKVTLHSTPRETKSDENGVARFEGVEVGEHRVVIAYKSQTGEQKINIKEDSESDEIHFTIQITTTNPFLNPWVIGVFTLLTTALLISLAVILRSRKSAKL